MRLTVTSFSLLPLLCLAAPAHGKNQQHTGHGSVQLTQDKSETRKIALNAAFRSAVESAVENLGLSGATGAKVVGGMPDKTVTSFLSEYRVTQERERDQEYVLWLKATVKMDELVDALLARADRSKLSGFRVLIAVGEDVTLTAGRRSSAKSVGPNKVEAALIERLLQHGVKVLDAPEKLLVSAREFQERRLEYAKKTKANIVIGGTARVSAGRKLIGTSQSSVNGNGRFFATLVSDSMILAALSDVDPGSVHHMSEEAAADRALQHIGTQAADRILLKLLFSN